MFDNFTLPLQKILVISAERNKGLFLYLPRLMIITVQDKRLITQVQSAKFAFGQRCFAVCVQLIGQALVTTREYLGPVVIQAIVMNVGIEGDAENHLGNLLGRLGTTLRATG